MKYAFTLAVLSLVVFASNAFAETKIALIGDDYRTVILREVAERFKGAIESTGQEKTVSLRDKGHVVSVLGKGATHIQIANQLEGAHIAVVVVDSIIGPLPIIREHIILARQANVPVVTVLLGNVGRLNYDLPADAVELLELEELEMRELLSVYEMGGDSTLVFYDRKSAYTGPPLSGMGIAQTFDRLFELKPLRLRKVPATRVRQFTGEFYLLSQPEANYKGISLSKGSQITIWSEGTDSVCSVTSSGPFNPADVTRFNVAVQGRLIGAAGSRVVLLDRGNLIGVGVVTQVGP